MTRFTLRNPCAHCPFLKEGGVRLHPEHVREIAHAVTDNTGSVFPCHETVEYDDDGEYVPQPFEQHCYGALVFAERSGSVSQLVRIAERLHAYDARAVRANASAAARVFSSLGEMLAAQDEHER